MPGQGAEIEDFKMTSSTLQAQALSERYSEYETDFLLELWSKEERVPWAETLLKEELQSRGVEPSVLEQLAAQRDVVRTQLQEGMDQAEFTVLGPFLAMLVCGLLAAVANAVWGTEAAIAIALAVGTGFSVMLWRNLGYRARANGGVPNVAIAKGYLLLAIVVALLLFGAFTMLRMLAAGS
jgi:hypothetical protein